MSFGARLGIFAFLAIALIVGIITFFSSINIIQEGTVGVVRRFGVVTETITPGGLNMRFSWIHSVERFDVRMREADLHFAANTADAQIVLKNHNVFYISLLKLQDKRFYMPISSKRSMAAAR